jgi:hypothetical protein
MGVKGNPKEFNYRTSARMLYVHAYMKIHSKQNVFHLENDNLVYTDLETYAHAIIACGLHMAAGQRNKHEAVLGFFFAQSSDVLLHMIEFWIEQWTAGPRQIRLNFAEYVHVRDVMFLNDMSMSMLYMRMHPGRLAVLPASDVSGDPATQCVYDRIGAILDNGNQVGWCVCSRTRSCCECVCSRPCSCVKC